MKITNLIVVIVFSFLFISGKNIEKSDTISIEAKRPNIVFMIADDWSFPHAGVYGDNMVRTPVFDQLAKEGALFENAYCAAPSCAPSRASILLSKYPHQMESAGNLWSVIPKKFPNWVSILRNAGYHSGKSRKGWAPGDFKAGGYEYNPAGKEYADFDAFLKDKNPAQPFVYWFGSTDPHRTYETNTGVKTGMDINAVRVPGFLPDVACVKNDIMDYYFEVERFDRESGKIINRLERDGHLENTIIIMTSDNGMPFPRAKANLYDYGTRMPLAIYWKGHIEGGKRISDFMNFIDFGPTILEAVGVDIPDSFQGKSLLELFYPDRKKSDRDKVFLERERHANVRKGDLSYPMRAVRTKEYLYIKNFEPERWPGGDPETYVSVGQYGDVDNSISKFLIMNMEDKPTDKDYFKLAFSKRPSEELYSLADDAYNLNNIAYNKKYNQVLNTMRNELKIWMIKTGDLRATKPQTTYWDKVLYTPDYQHSNFNLMEKIKSYKMLKNENGKYKGAFCL
ncbi:sulfatase [Aurantibacter crassamenti]|uniref:sulfatase family protein n=1 Tax=Aurantibacter crassamenti TaxID=1837375 RepID=UPI00193A5CF2|nr:sulfatase [Aurantibacter crassamenti]MBM1105204.1 sulfatase [Aurantibacter crassamenti]